MITIENLLQNKEIIQASTGVKEVELEIKRLKDTVKIKSLDVNKLLNLVDSCKNQYEANVKIVYYGMVEPNLKDNELQEAYKVKTNPYKIVESIFKPIEINLIADKVCEISGLKDVENMDQLVQEVKKKQKLTQI